jgi:hypothetical protein
MLNAHPDLAVPGESLCLIDYLRAERRVSLAEAARLLLREQELEEWGIRFTAGEIEGQTGFAEVFAFLHRRFAEKQGKPRWGNKTPRFVRYGDLLKRAFPGARFVHVVRDPRAVANSLVRSVVHRSTPLHAARRWVRDTGAGRGLARRYPGDCLEVRYEDLVASPEEVLRSVCGFLDVPFSDRMFSYREHAEESGSAYHGGIHARLRQPADRSRAEAWKTELSARAVALVECEAGPLMDELGYPREAGELAAGETYRLALRCRRLFVDLPLQLAHYRKGRGRLLVHSIRRKRRLGLLGQDLHEIHR